MNNVFLFTGTEAYTLHQELKKWKSAFLEKYGEQGLFVFQSNELNKTAIINCIFSGGMFTNKKLIIIYGIPKDNYTPNKALASQANPLEELLMKKWEHIPGDSIVVLVSYKPDKRTKAYKFFSKHTEIKEFKELKGNQLTQFVVQKLGGLIDTNEAHLLISLVGNNLFSLANECDKLKAYAHYHNLEKLTTKHIQDIVYIQSEIDSFKILDVLCTEKEKTLEYITNYQKQGVDIFQFLGILYRGLKIMIQMVYLYKQGITHSKDIAKTIAVHPFVIAKQIKNIKKIEQHIESLKDFYRDIIKLDYAIKSGKYPPEAFWTEIKRVVHAL